MSEELRPCPFCGAEVQDDERGEKYPRKSPMGGWIIHCECCGASLSQFRKSGKGEISWNTRPIEDALNARIAELEAENDRLQDAWFKDETICPDGSLKPKVSALLSRIAELSQSVGLITTLKPTMVMDAEHPLEMAKEVAEYVTARIAELEEERRWMPVSEPPKVSGKYLLLNIYDDVYPCDFIAGTEIWVLPDYDTVTHWMPLPQLPEVRE